MLERFARAVRRTVAECGSFISAVKLSLREGPKDTASTSEYFDVLDCPRLFSVFSACPGDLRHKIQTSFLLETGRTMLFAVARAFSRSRYTYVHTFVCNTRMYQCPNSRHIGCLENTTFPSQLKGEFERMKEREREEECISIIFP